MKNKKQGQNKGSQSKKGMMMSEKQMKGNMKNCKKGK